LQKGLKKIVYKKLLMVM